MCEGQAKAVLGETSVGVRFLSSHFSLLREELAIRTFLLTRGLHVALNYNEGM